MIETKRLVIRKFTEADIDLIFDINNHPECIEFNGWDSMSMDQCEAVLEKWMMKYTDITQTGVFCVECKEEKSKIGMAFIVPYKGPNQYEIGFRLRRVYWNKGYAKEITGTFIQYAETKLNANEVIAEVYKNNVRSRNIFEKLGFDMSDHPDGDDGLIFSYKIKGYDA